MKFLDTTIGSTHAIDNAVKIYMPPAEATTVLAYFDRYQALEAKQPDPGHARKTRSQNIETLVLLALDNARLRADLMALEPCYRVSKVISHLNCFSKDRGDIKKRYNITKAPCRKKVREILIKHNFM